MRHLPLLLAFISLISWSNADNAVLAKSSALNSLSNETIIFNKDFEDQSLTSGGWTAQSESPAKTVVKARNFEIIVDEPEALGGTDVAPNPVEYVLASFAGCLNVMGHLVAKEMGFELKNLKIDIEGNLNPAKLFGKCDQERAGYKGIAIKMIPETDADESILEKWLHEVECRCPVSDNLQNETPVSIEMEKLSLVS